MGDNAPPRTPQTVVQTHVRCPNCTYDLTGFTVGSACPECGLVIGRGIFDAAAQLPTSGKAVASLILGILAIVGCSTYGVVSIPCGIIAIVLARQVKQQIIAQEVSPSSESLAKAGSICGIVGMCVGGLMLVFLLAVFVLAAFA